jgi:hypothetical protein
MHSCRDSRFSISAPDIILRNSARFVSGFLSGFAAMAYAQTPDTPQGGQPPAAASTPQRATAPVDPFPHFRFRFEGPLARRDKLKPNATRFSCSTFGGSMTTPLEGGVGLPILAADPLSSGSSRLKAGLQARLPPPLFRRLLVLQLLLGTGERIFYRNRANRDRIHSNSRARPISEPVNCPYRTRSNDETSFRR